MPQRMWKRNLPNYMLCGEIEVDRLYSGDIGAIGKLASTRTGDTLSTRQWPIEYHPTTMSKPYTYMAYRAVNKGDEDKMAQALTKLCIEDLTLKTVSDEENRQSLIYGIGEQQLQIVASKLEDRYKVKVELTKPRIAFRENIKNSQEDTDSTEMLLWSLNLQGICQNHIFLKKRYLVELYLRISSQRWKKVYRNVLRQDR